MAEAFGRFWLQQKIGQGGMAEIFRATVGPGPSSYAFDFVVKRLLPEAQNDAAQRDMFLTEADLATHLRHPNLVQVYESGLIDGRAYIAMEHVSGLDLMRLLSLLRRRGLRFPVDLAVYVAMQVLRTLDYVHRARAVGGRDLELIHRDVTPSNIFVSARGEVKLGDFGVARVSFLEPGDDAGVVKGKVAYTPPEVLAGHPIEQRDDLWSLALTLYEMLAGRSPYSGIDEADLLSGAVRAKIVPLRKLQPDVDARLSSILVAALHPKPRRRPADAVTLYRQLKAYVLDTGVRVEPAALAAFLRHAMGEGSADDVAPIAPVVSGASPTEFAPPEYAFPVGMSPTQRIELQGRSRRRRKPWLAAAVVVAALAAGIGVWQRGRTAHSLSPREAMAQASELIDRGRLDAAARLLDEVERREPRNPELYLVRGDLCRRRGDIDAARRAYRRVIFLEPTGRAARLARPALQALALQ